MFLNLCTKLFHDSPSSSSWLHGGVSTVVRSIECCRERRTMLGERSPRFNHGLDSHGDFGSQLGRFSIFSLGLVFKVCNDWEAGGFATVTKSQRLNTARIFFVQIKSALGVGTLGVYPQCRLLPSRAPPSQHELLENRALPLRCFWLQVTHTTSTFLSMATLNPRAKPDFKGPGKEYTYSVFWFQVL